MVGDCSFSVLTPEIRAGGGWLLMPTHFTKTKSILLLTDKLIGRWRKVNTNQKR
jgi:hypothetical protein